MVQSPNTCGKDIPATRFTDMKIELVKKYREDQFTFDVLKKEYGIFDVRGPRGIPNSLSAALKKG